MCCFLQAWGEAREKTLAAKNEAASAQLAGKKARHELSAAEKAAVAVQTAQSKHREVLICSGLCMWVASIVVRYCRDLPGQRYLTPCFVDSVCFGVALHSILG